MHGRTGFSSQNCTDFTFLNEKNSAKQTIFKKTIDVVKIMWYHNIKII